MTTEEDVCERIRLSLLPNHIRICHRLVDVGLALEKLSSVTEDVCNVIDNDHEIKNKFLPLFSRLTERYDASNDKAIELGQELLNIKSLIEEAVNE